MKADGRDYNQNTRAVGPHTSSMRPLKDMFNDDYVKSRFKEVLGEKAPAFLASVLNATRTNAALNECEPKSVMSAAMVAASLDLPIDGSLGFAAIVPYKNKGKMVAQFQIMTKGFVQLALRSGQYKTINVGPVYEDEFDSYDIITGEVFIHPVDGGYRDQDLQDKIVGYVAFFRLINGFERIEFWSMKKIQAHGKRFSKSYGSDYGLWKTDLPSMAAKTVLKNTLSKWGILSTTMQIGMKTDQASIRDFDGKTLDDANVDYVDSTSSGTEDNLSEGANGAQIEQEGPSGASGQKSDANPVQGSKNASQPTPAQTAPASKAAPGKQAAKPAEVAPEATDEGLFNHDPTQLRPDGEDLF